MVLISLERLRPACPLPQAGLFCLEGRRDRSERLWGRSLGHQIRGHCPELATGLGRSRPVLCLPRRGAPAVVHDQCHRGPELKAPTRGVGA